MAKGHWAKARPTWQTHTQPIVFQPISAQRRGRPEPFSSQRRRDIFATSALSARHFATDCNIMSDFAGDDLTCPRRFVGAISLSRRTGPCPHMQNARSKERALLPTRRSAHVEGPGPFRPACSALISWPGGAGRPEFRSGPDRRIPRYRPRARADAPAWWADDAAQGLRRRPDLRCGRSSG